MNAPIIVTALFEAADQRLFDDLRRRHFPPERNLLDAHLTLFHHLPPSAAADLHGRLRQEATEGPPEARIAGVINLGGGTALRIESAGLQEVRARLADAFDAVLIPQDRAGWRPHVTIQNKVSKEAARTLQAELGGRLDGRVVRVWGLASWLYRGGPWEPMGRYPFRRGRED